MMGVASDATWDDDGFLPVMPLGTVSGSMSLKQQVFVTTKG